MSRQRRIRDWLAPAALSVLLMLTFVGYKTINLDVPSFRDEEIPSTQQAGETSVVRSEPGNNEAETTSSPTEIALATPTQGLVTLTPTPTPSATRTPTLTSTATPTDTPTQTNTPTKTPVPTPSTTPTPTPRPPSVEILADQVTIHAGPGQKFRKVGQARKGEILIVQSKNLNFEDDPWFLIRIKDGQEEWITGNTRDVQRYNVANLSSRMGPATYTPVPPPTPVVLASNIRDFSGNQGANNWKYLMEDARNSGRWQSMTFGDYQSKQCWLTGNWEKDVRICRKGEVHPGASTRIAYEWRANVKREIKISIHAHKVDTGCGDGVSIATFKAIDGKGMVEKLGEFQLSKADNRGITKNYNTRIDQSMLIYVIVDIRGNSQCDATKLTIDVY